MEHGSLTKLTIVNTDCLLETVSFNNKYACRNVGSSDTPCSRTNASDGTPNS